MSDHIAGINLQGSLVLIKAISPTRSLPNREIEYLPIVVSTHVQSRYVGSLHWTFHVLTTHKMVYFSEVHLWMLAQSLSLFASLNSPRDVPTTQIGQQRRWRKKLKAIPLRWAEQLNRGANSVKILEIFWPLVWIRCERSFPVN